MGNEVFIMRKSYVALGKVKPCENGAKLSSFDFEIALRMREIKKTRLILEFLRSNPTGDSHLVSKAQYHQDEYDLQKEDILNVRPKKEPTKEYDIILV